MLIMSNMAESTTDTSAKAQHSPSNQSSQMFLDFLGKLPYRCNVKVKFNWFFACQGPILLPSFMEICVVVCCIILLTSQQMAKGGVKPTALAELMIGSLLDIFQIGTLFG